MLLFMWPVFELKEVVESPVVERSPPLERSSALTTAKASAKASAQIGRQIEKHNLLSLGSICPMPHNPLKTARRVELCPL